MIYFASPYSSPDPKVAQLRHDLVQEAMAHFMEQGTYIYSPIVLCHNTALKYALPTDAKYWEAYNNNTIRRCDEMWVFMIDGWEQSIGVTAEIEFAKLISIPIYYITPDWSVKDFPNG